MPEIVINVSDEDFALLEEVCEKNGEPIIQFFTKKILAELNAETGGAVTLDRLEELATGQRLIAARIDEVYKELAYDHEDQKAENADVTPTRILNVITSRASGLRSSAVDAVQDYLIGNGVDPLGLDDL